MKWYLIWFFLVETSNGDVNRTYTQSKELITQTECIIEAREKEISLEQTLGLPHTVTAGWRAYSYGTVVGFTVGCKQSEPKRRRSGSMF